MSAGAICWCKYGNSATRHNKDGRCTPVRVRGIGFLNLLYCPHCSRDYFREETTRKMLERTPGMIGLLMDYAAIVINGDRFKLIGLDERQVAKKVYWENGKYYCRTLSTVDYVPLSELYALDGKEMEL